MVVRLLDPVVGRCPGLPFSSIRHKDPWTLLDDPRFLDCLATMHPASLPGLLSRRARRKPGQRPSDVRRAELTLYRFLARFCSRNDTTGTAGSTFWGRLGPGPTLLEGDGSLRRVLWPSPRHAELLSHRLAHGPLRSRARLALVPRYFVMVGLLFEPHENRYEPLTTQEQEVLRHLGCRLEELPWGLAFVAESLLERGVLTLRLGEPGQDRLEALRGEPVADRLTELRGRLQDSSGLEFVRLMAEADGLCPCPTLDPARALRHLVHLALDDPSLRLELLPSLRQEGDFLRAPHGATRPLSAGERSALETGRPRPDVVQLLDEGILVVAGSRQNRLGWPWFHCQQEIGQALAAQELSPGLREQVELFCSLRPRGPIQLNPVAAEAELATRLNVTRHPELTVPGQDRSFFVCDSARRLDFQLGDELRRRLEGQLQAWFRLAGWQEFNRERLTRPLARNLKAGSLSRFLQQLREADPDHPDLEEMRQRVVSQDMAKWRAVPCGDHVQLEEVGQVPEFDRWLRNKRLVTSLDLMLGGTLRELNAGGGTLIVSEAHDGGEGLGLTTFFPHSHPDRSLEGFASHVFGSNMLFLQPSVPNKQAEGILVQLADTVLAVESAEGWWPHRRTVPISHLRVTRGWRGWEVCDEEQSYRLITPWLSLGNVRTVGNIPSRIACWVDSMLPGPRSQDDVHSYPEIRLGELVLSRATYELPSKLFHRLELPRFVFVKTRWKPMLIDLDSPLAREVLAAELERAPRVSVTPMQPAPDELWLQMGGEGYCSELRVVALSDGPRFRL